MLSRVLANPLGLCAVWVFASPTLDAYMSYEARIPGNFSAHEPKPAPPRAPSARPPFGRLPDGSSPHSPSRTKVCYVQSNDDLVTDDSEYILQALKECNDGGHVVFPKGTTYLIGTALDLTFLSHVDLDIQGYIQFTNDTDYWQAHAFKQIYQNATTFFKLGGIDVNVYGGGTLDGNGQAWYDLYVQNNLVLRPVIFGTIGLHSGFIGNLNLVYSPFWYNFVPNSSNVVFSDIFVTGYSKSNNTARNTDGWDVYRSSDITIQNSTINNGDDCVSFKPNSSSILVQNMHCNGSHGISVGSLGQYIGETDIVEDILVRNISMFNASDGARIKVWPGVASELSGELQGGGGMGMVRNVVYDGMTIQNVDYGIEITQCYGQSNLTLCNEFPANLTISNITFRNFQGTTSPKLEPLVGYLVCSSNTTCSNITAENINLVSPNGTKEFQCENVDQSTLAVQCVDLLGAKSN